MGFLDVFKRDKGKKDLRDNRINKLLNNENIPLLLI